jgi:hypothetical protein
LTPLSVIFIELGRKRTENSSMRRLASHFCAVSPHSIWIALERSLDTP